MRCGFLENSTDNTTDARSMPCGRRNCVPTMEQAVGHRTSANAIVAKQVNEWASHAGAVVIPPLIAYQPASGGGATRRR